MQIYKNVSKKRGKSKAPSVSFPIFLPGDGIKKYKDRKEESLSSNETSP